MREKLVIIYKFLLLMYILLPAVSIGANLKIKQQSYLYQMPLTQNVYSETFVISPRLKQEELKKDSQQNEATNLEKNVRTTNSSVARFTDPIIVYFQIDSYKIDPGEEGKMISAIEALGISQNTPLLVTGFTCQKGPEKFNKWLSNQRAKTVAKKLQQQGYLIVQIKGVGSENLVTRNYPPFNRRVEIRSAQ